MSSTVWRIRLGEEAERDFARILRYTAEKFGRQQAEVYQATLASAVAALLQGPDVPGSAARDEIQPGLRSLHVARQGQKGRHFLMYRAKPGVIEIIRILHDAMDFARHIPPNDD